MATAPTAIGPLWHSGLGLGPTEASPALLGPRHWRGTGDVGFGGLFPKTNYEPRCGHRYSSLESPENIHGLAAELPRAVLLIPGLPSPPRQAEGVGSKIEDPYPQGYTLGRRTTELQHGAHCPGREPHAPLTSLGPAPHQLGADSQLDKCPVSAEAVVWPQGGWGSASWCVRWCWTPLLQVLPSLRMGWSSQRPAAPRCRGRTWGPRPGQ